MVQKNGYVPRKTSGKILSFRLLLLCGPENWLTGLLLLSVISGNAKAENSPIASEITKMHHFLPLRCLMSSGPLASLLVQYCRITPKIVTLHRMTSTALSSSTILSVAVVSACCISPEVWSGVASFCMTLCWTQVALTMSFTPFCPDNNFVWLTLHRERSIPKIFNSSSGFCNLMLKMYSSCGEPLQG